MNDYEEAILEEPLLILLHSVLPLASKKPLQLLGKSTQHVPFIDVMLSEEVI